MMRTSGIVCILFDVHLGNGRPGPFFAHEHLGFRPHVLTVATPMDGGWPMGAILATQAIGQTLQPGDHVTTFGGGPFVSSVALHVFDRLSDPGLLDGMARLI